MSFANSRDEAATLAIASDLLFITLGCTLQTCGAAMNAQLNTAMSNRWLASTIFFGIITAFSSVSLLPSLLLCPVPKGSRLCPGGLPWADW